MNALERAVIEAARVLYRRWKETVEHVHADTAARSQQAIDALSAAVLALDEHERALTAAGLTKIPWAQVTDGDELRSAKGNFFPVTHTRREWKMGRSTGNFLITVRLPAGDRVLTRPTPAEQTATVRRGDAGKAVDLMVHVFESGEI